MSYYTKRFELGKRAIYDVSSASDRDIKLLSFLKPEDFRWRVRFLEEHRLGPFVTGSGSEILKRINERWLQEIRSLNLESVAVPPSSIDIRSKDVYKIEQSADIVKFHVSGNVGANFSIHLNEIPNWKNSQPRRILFIHSQTANHVRIECKRSTGVKVFRIYSLPTVQHGRVFRWVVPKDIQKLAFRLDYSSDPPFEDQLKVICFLPREVDTIPVQNK